EAAKQLSIFFAQMHQSANLRISGTPSAPVIEGGKTIPIGRCTADSEAQANFIEGIDTTRAPELNCGSPLACLYCKNFGIRDSYEDIHRLLSAYEYIKVQSRHKSQSIQEHANKFLHALARIEEIVDSFSNRDESSNSIAVKAKSDVDKGNLDKFWLALVNS